ncbi:unnamed protein product, partial [Laminaria digitata]
QHRHPKHNGGGGGGAITGPQWRWDAATYRWTWDDSGLNPFGTGGQVPPMGWVPTDPPPGAMPPMPPPPAGWGPSPGGARKGRRGRCFRCNQPGHYVAECPAPPPHMNIAVPSQLAGAYVSPAPAPGVGYAAAPYASSMSYGGRWLQETPYGSGGYTSAGNQPPQPSSSPPNLMDNGSSAP